jgi:hypothetical protein
MWLYRSVRDNDRSDDEAMLDVLLRDDGQPTHRLYDSVHTDAIGVVVLEASRM